jgi:hypothetical protein
MHVIKPFSINMVNKNKRDGHIHLAAATLLVPLCPATLLVNLDEVSSTPGLPLSALSVILKKEGQILLLFSSSVLESELDFLFMDILDMVIVLPVIVFAKFPRNRKLQ